MGDLEDKRVVISAAASGLGRVLGQRFVEAGARVFGCDVAGVEEANLPEGFTLERADASDPDEIARFFDRAVSQMGGLDILVNNAGIAGPVGSLESVTFEGWRETMAVNIDGHFLFAQRAVPLFKAQGTGAIVNISSTAGQFGYANRSPYVASKWAVIGLTKALAVELGPHGIRANAVCPGALTGDRMDRVIAAQSEATGEPEQAVRDSIVRTNAMGTWIDPNDIADTVLFLCSEAGKRISGEVVAVDGHTINIDP